MSKKTCPPTKLFSGYLRLYLWDANRFPCGVPTERAILLW